MSGKSKRSRLEQLSIDMSEVCIIAHFNTEHYGSEIDPNTGQAMVLETSQGSKRVRLPKHYDVSEIPGLAQEVVDKCKYIPNSRLEEVSRLMHEIHSNLNWGVPSPVSLHVS